MHRIGLIKNISLYAFLLIVILFLPTRVFASVAGEVNKANTLYKQGKFDDSLELYQEALDQDEKSSVVKYNLGTAWYKKGDYTKALEYLKQSAQDKNIKIKSKSEYNLGNVLYKTGIQKENTNVDAAIKSLQEALGKYGQSLSDVPKDQDAIFNQNFVKKEIERLKQKKQQQKQKQQQKKGQQNQQNQKENQQSNSKDQKNQNSQGNNQQQSSPQKQSESQAQKQQNAQSQSEQSQKELDRKQAEDLLEDYRENEEPKKLLNYMPKKIDNRPVLKDW